MTERAVEQPAWHAAGRQKALALLRLGPSAEAFLDRYRLLEQTADEDGAQLVAMVWELLALVEQPALAAFGEEAWMAWLDEQIAALALQQTTEG